MSDCTVVKSGERAQGPQGVSYERGLSAETEPVRFVVARTDPNEEESVVLLPELW
jgi:uncharacterized RmlC-like cupin family protein